MSTVVYNKNEYVVNMRKRINKPTCWQDIMEVKISDNYTIVRGALTTEVPVVGGTRGTAYVYGTYVLAQDTQTINQVKNVPMFIDEADRTQQSYVNQMSVAELHGKKISEFLESAVLASHASWQDFGATDLTNTGADDDTKISISASNIDDVIRAVKRKIYEHNGVDFAVENGIFFEWRAQDFEFLEAFVQANGYVESDIALKNGIPVQKAFYYLGAYHYLSTQHTANHIFCGIRKMGILGILRGTYGRVKFIEDPGQVSGLGIVGRLDYGFDWCGSTSYYKDFFIDLNVN